MLKKIVNMKSKLNYDYSLSIIVLLFCLTNISRADYEKHRRGGSMGLIPFARVGRSDPNLSNEFRQEEADIDNNLDPAYFADYEDMLKMESKRAAMFNQPRIGRADPFMFKTQRIGRNAHSMFNQPRIGRVDPQLRDLSRLLAIQRTLEKRTGPSATSGMWFGPRLGKRSTDMSEASTLASPPKGQPEEY